MFRVLLTSPEGAVMGGVSQAQVTIGRSGSGTGGRDASGPALLGRTAHRSPDGDNVSTAGGCPLNQGQRGQQGQQGPVLGGQEIPSDGYPQHGSIQLEKLPLGTGSLVWTRGDGVPRPSEDAEPKVRVLGGPRVVSVAAGGCGPRVHQGSGPPTQPGLNGPALTRQVPPSSVFHNGTDVVLRVSPQHRRTSWTASWTSPCLRLRPSSITPSRRCRWTTTGRPRARAGRQGSTSGRDRDQDRHRDQRLSAVPAAPV